MITFKLPERFMLGTATASTQIEGGDTNNTWYKWSETGHISDSSSSINACDHWNRVEQDTEILKSLNVQTHRMSLEWSRIEPEAGVFSDEAMKHYRDEIRLLLDNNIEPLVTLHHFSDPLWFDDMGGWKKPENSELFIEYVRYVVENLGDLVCEWVTFNEPNVYTTFGYLLGIFPPGVRNPSEAFKVSAEIIKTHVKLYHLIHNIRDKKKFEGKTRVGAAMHLRVFDGITYVGRRTAGYVDYFFHELFMAGFTAGRLKRPLPRSGYKYKKGRYVDFLGINYYTRNIVEFVFDPSNYFYKLINDKNLNKTDLGWDIYPEGIYRVCKKYYRKYKLPIYITENGISDKYDNRRPDYIANHLAYLAKAIDEGIKIERYYHWTLMDNFEWLEGETANFGLYHCNFRTQKRTARQSAELFAHICKRKELTKEMISEFSKKAGIAIHSRAGVGNSRSNDNLKPNGQDKYFSGYGGIEDPIEYVNSEYGSGWIESKTVQIYGIDCFTQSELEEYANNCTLASITRIMKYYSDRGYTNIPSDTSQIYKKVREIGVKHGYDPEKTGLLRSLFVYTPWEIDNMAKNTWRVFGYSKGDADNGYLCKLGTIQSNIDNLNPLLLNITAGDYKGHTVSVIGYKVFSKEGKKDKTFVQIFDGWSETERYIDWTKFRHTPGSVTKFLPPPKAKT